MDNSNDEVYHASDWRDRGLNGQQLNGLRPNIVQLVLLCQHGSPILALVQYRPYHNDIANSAPPPLGYWKSCRPRAKYYGVQN